ncbi:hypothetical protein C8R47DRAFT_1152309 [Mycena vitilis]|nr:hypothetical protein C8R47DRAFT_1152309 [Mycena vitilis]
MRVIMTFASLHRDRAQLVGSQHLETPEQTSTTFFTSSNPSSWLLLNMERERAYGYVESGCISVDARRRAPLARDWCETPRLCAIRGVTNHPFRHTAYTLQSIRGVTEQVACHSDIVTVYARRWGVRTVLQQGLELAPETTDQVRDAASSRRQCSPSPLFLSTVEARTKHRGRCERPFERPEHSQV